MSSIFGTPKQETPRREEERKHQHTFDEPKSSIGSSGVHQFQGQIGGEEPSTFQTIKRGLTGDYPKESGPSGIVRPEQLEQELRQSNFKIGSSLAVVGAVFGLIGSMLAVTGGALSLANLLPKRRY